jgi:hypothetical protein
VRVPKGQDGKLLRVVSNICFTYSLSIYPATSTALWIHHTVDGNNSNVNFKSDLKLDV